MPEKSRLPCHNEKFVAKLTLATDFDGCMDVLAEHLGAAGFERAAYSYMPLVRRANGTWLRPPLKVRNFPPRWDAQWERYSVHDPYFHACFGRTISVDWTAVQRDPNLTAIQRECINYLAHFGLRKGLTIPIHLPHGGLAFITAIADPERDDWAELVELSRYRLLVQAHQFQRIALEKLMPVSEHDSTRLTSREAECLNLTGQGWSYSETARALGLSIDTIRLHLRSACGKLGAANRAHAVAKAITLGLIDINLRAAREGEAAALLATPLCESAAGSLGPPEALPIPRRSSTPPARPSEPAGRPRRSPTANSSSSSARPRSVPSP
jgi:LuxR family transcriptional regulator, quorum-sensing system regulator SdiA